jgi:predicted transposase/invertase (TIGR01784 family)
LEGKLEVAKALKATGMSTSQIAQITGFSIQEMESL